MNDKEKKELLDVLKRSPLCRNLEEGEMERLLVKEGTVRSFSRGERGFQETDRPEAVYVLLDGSVIIAKETFSGKRILLTQLEMPGVLFGEVYVFMEKSSYDLPDAVSHTYQNYMFPGKQLHNLRRIYEDMRTHQNSSDTLQDRLP